MRAKNFQNNLFIQWTRLLCLPLAILALFLTIQPVFAVISPQYLKSGRTYDQETSYIQWNGSVSYVSLYHADGTSLPPSEGGGSCGAGCTETVTRIQNGASVSGNFTYLSTFNVQVAYSGAGGVGTAVIKACGQTIATQNMYMAGSGTPGFVNFPAPAWNVPTSGDCTWSISATGGYVDFRAVTTGFRSTPAPTVDLKVNGTDGPFNVAPPASYSLSWTSTNAASCSASSMWSGDQATNGSQAYSNIASGIYTYTLTCTNPSGSASDSVTVIVAGNPTVSVSAPAALTAPANYTATWTSTNAASCTGYSRFSGLTGLSGSKAETGMSAGAYDYTVTCVNAVGTLVTDTKRTTVYAAPTVDVKVDGLDGPTLTRTGPASYNATWTSSNATQCTGSARLAGYTGTSGSRSESNVPSGTTYDYTVTCQNAAGATASDTVHMVVVAAPTVDVKVNGSDGPLNFFEPAVYTVTWASSNATSCTALNNLPGPIAINGSRAFSAVVQGAYRYTVQCVNLAGTSISDSVLVNVNPLPPVVDLKIEGGDSPITRDSPAAYTLTWTSTYATSCSASSSDLTWSGAVLLTGNRVFSSVPVGTHTYTLTCSNVSGSVSDSVTATVVAPLSGTISAAYSKLLLYAPKLGQAAQTLAGSVSGGVGPYSVTVHVFSPGGAESTYSLSGSSWTLTPAGTGNLNFGTTQEGVWRAWAAARDSAGRNYQTSSVTWEVSWFPVHGRP
jgi:hypothetical protein